MMQFEVLYSAGRLLETFGERRHSNARFNVAFAHHRCHRAQPVSITRTHQARCTTAPLSTNRRSCQSPIDRLCVKKSMPDRERERAENSFSPPPIAVGPSKFYSPRPRRAPPTTSWRQDAVVFPIGSVKWRRWNPWPRYDRHFVEGITCGVKGRRFIVVF